MKKKREMEQEMAGHAMDDPEMSESMHDAMAEGHMKTLMEAHKIKSNPEHMNRVKQLAGRHKKILVDIEEMDDGKPKSIEDLGKIYTKKFGTKKVK